jgi:hypothetical protein
VCLNPRAEHLLASTHNLKCQWKHSRNNAGRGLTPHAAVFQQPVRARTSTSTDIDRIAELAKEYPKRQFLIESPDHSGEVGGTFRSLRKDASAVSGGGLKRHEVGNGPIQPKNTYRSPGLLYVFLVICLLLAIPILQLASGERQGL